MTQEALVVGIDVSRETLDVVILPTGEVLSLPNGAEGWRRLVRRLVGKPLAVVAFEATGGYERGLLKALAEADLPAARVNPGRVRAFANASGTLAKNDKLDALTIARFTQALPPRRTVCDPVIDALAELVTARRQIVKDITRTANQADHAVNPVLKRSFRRRLRGLEAELKLVDIEIAKAMAADQGMASRGDILRSAPGVGPVASATFLALLPELGKLENRQVAGLVGVAPYDRDSGQMRGQRSIWGGRKPVRDILYMAALGAIRSKGTIFKACYDRLIASGKTPKVAIVAVMRKLITTLNAMLRNNTAWSPT